MTIGKFRNVVAVAWVLCVLCPCYCFAAYIAPSSSGQDAEALIVRVPDVQHHYYKTRDVYFHRLLDMALRESGRRYTLVKVPLPEFKESRSEHFLLDQTYDVHWLNVTSKREKSLLSVPVPLYKGLIGWRALFIREGDQAAFDGISSVEQLQTKVLVQGYDWADTPLLKAVGFNVEMSTNWEGVFEMLRLGRVDCFPRSIIEIWAEQQSNEARGLEVESQLILHYPAAYFFFVRKNNLPLAEALTIGLDKLIASGQFDALFNEFFAEHIARAKVEGRTILSIPNVDAESFLPLERNELWYRPDLPLRVAP